MKERINITNYEAWMLDYVEGTLHDEQLAEFLAFMDKHPELYAELDEFDPEFVLPEENIKFGNTLELKKSDPLPPVNLENYEDYFVRHIEGELNEKEELAITTFIGTHPEKEKELNLYKKTILPVETIAYPNKSELKRKDGTVIPLGRWVSVASAAAAIALLFIWTPWESQQGTENGSQFAGVSEQKAENSEQLAENREQKAEISEQATVDRQTNNPSTDSRPQPTENRQTMDPISSPAIAFAPEKRTIITNVGTLYDPNMVTPINDLPDPQQDLAVTDPGSDDDYVKPGQYLREKLLQGVESVTGKDASFQKSEESEYVATNLSIGGFEFSRKKKK